MVGNAVGACVLAAAAGAAAVTICDVQAYNAVGFSPLDGNTVTVRGIVTLPPGLLQPTRTSMYIQQRDCGINVFCFDPLTFTLALGDSVKVTGQVEEYVNPAGAGATTEILCDSIDRIVLLSSGHPAPEPAFLPIEDITVEACEGRFVRAHGIVLETDLVSTMYLGDETDYIQIYRANNNSVNFGSFRADDTLTVTGVVLQYDRTSPYFDGYELVPRYQSDLVVGGIPDTTAPVYAAEARLTVKPRPFHPDVGEAFPITYAAPDRSHTVMTVYDLQGRIVRTLVPAGTVYDGRSTLPQLGGERMRGWDGRDDMRRLVSPGVYVLRLEVTDRNDETSVVTAPAVVGARLR